MSYFVGTSLNYINLIRPPCILLFSAPALHHPQSPFMRITQIIACCLVLPCLYLAPAHAQKKLTIAVLGSSTAAGENASSPAKSYLGLLKAHLQSLGELDTLYNFGLPGSTTYSGMPTGFVPPAGRDAPEPSFNVTRALQLGADIVLVNYPGNDITRGYSLADFMSNLHTIYDTVIAAHKICAVTTTQPRTDLTLDLQQLLQTCRDSILLEFPVCVLNFWDPIVAPNSLDLNPIYDSGDGTHLNDSGHYVLYQVVIAAECLTGIALPLTLTNFTATPQQQGILLAWTGVNEDPNTVFDIQRSADGTSFGDIEQEKGQGRGQAVNYSWTDKAPLPGASFYRLKIIAAGNESFSKIVGITLSEKELAIGKVYTANGNTSLVAEITTRRSQTVTIAIFSTTGAVIRQQSSIITPPLTKILLPVTNLAAGTYFLQVRSVYEDPIVKAFPIF